MNPFGNNTSGIQGYGDMMYWGIVVAGLLAALVVFRFVARRLVNRRVRGIDVEKIGFTDIDSMKSTGLMSEEEMKLVRKRYAERQLAEMKEEEAAETGIPAEQLLQLYEADPNLAKTHIESMNPLVRQSLGEWLDKKAAKEGTAPPPGVATGAGAVAGSADPRVPSENLAPPPTNAEVPPSMTAAQAEAIRSLKKPARTAKSRVTAPVSDSLDPKQLYAKGLISLKEFEMLMEKKGTKASGAEPAAHAPPAFEGGQPQQAQPGRVKTTTSGKTVDLELLHSKGLISDEEYTQLIAKMQSAQDD